MHMSFGLLGIGLLEVVLALPLAALWIAVVIWLARGKSNALVKVAVLAGTSLFTVGAIFAVLLLMRASPSSGSGGLFAASPRELTKNQALSVDASSQRALVYNIEEPASLQIEAVEIFGKNIEFRVLQDGKTIYSSGVHSGKAVGTVPVAMGTVTVSLVNANLLDTKSVQLSVTSLPR